MTESRQKNKEFHRKAPKIYDMPIAWHVYDVSANETKPHVIKQPIDFRCLNRRWRNDDKIVSRGIQPYPENVFYTDPDCYNFRNKMVKKTTHFNKPIWPLFS